MVGHLLGQTYFIESGLVGCHNVRLSNCQHVLLVMMLLYIGNLGNLRHVQGNEAGGKQTSYILAEDSIPIQYGRVGPSRKNPNC